MSKITQLQHTKLTAKTDHLRATFSNYHSFLIFFLTQWQTTFLLTLGRLDLTSTVQQPDVVKGKTFGFCA